jgi:ATP-dependent DNA ligase
MSISIPEFAVLYGESSHGKRKMWQVAVIAREDGAGVIRTTHGYEDGKKVVNERAVETGKNLGRANATTPLQQAISEAKALWKKKCDAGYKADGASASTSTTTEAAGGVASAAGASDTESVASTTATTGAGVPLPMLAHDFNKRGKSISFPCLVQPKFDGVRCVAIAGKGLFSRNGKAFPHMPHVKAEVDALPAGTVLDGELYSDDLTFQEIVGLVKKQTLKPADQAKMPKIHLAVYDLIVDDPTNAERHSTLTGLISGASAKHLRPVTTEECKSREDLARFHARWTTDGYEGVMLRNKAGKYRVGVRSVDLQKYKEFEDAEYKVVGFKEGDGVEKGCVVWLCVTSKDQEFAVRPRGTHE